MINSTIEIGDAFTFKPTCFFPIKGMDGRGGQNMIPIGREVTGTVVYINEPHHWFRVRYESFGYTYHECFPLPVPPAPERNRMEPYFQDRTLNKAKAWCDK